MRGERHVGPRDITWPWDVESPLPNNVIYQALQGLAEEMHILLAYPLHRTICACSTAMGPERYQSEGTRERKTQPRVSLSCCRISTLSTPARHHAPHRCALGTGPLSRSVARQHSNSEDFWREDSDGYLYTSRHGGVSIHAGF